MRARYTLPRRPARVFRPFIKIKTGRLPVIQQGKAIDALFHVLKEDLAALGEENARTCGNCLLNTFTDLVESMIGELLMSQILRSAWVGQPHGNI